MKDLMEFVGAVCCLVGIPVLIYFYAIGFGVTQ